MTAAEEIQLAILKMLSKPESSKPYVVINPVGMPEWFVQFCGSRQRALIFDVPRDGIHMRVKPELAADLTIKKLVEWGFHGDVNVEIEEHPTWVQ